ncbi:MAG: CBS domain-containing protein [Deltaproteobacteria bacterium]|nr:CBS domain-containing protein [Deltaproteobacteria bacterium]
MPNEKKVKDLMIPLEDYPHIPHWFTLRQAMAILREAAITFEGQFEPLAVLVFDEKYHLMGILSLRDIIKGLEPRFLYEKYEKITLAEAEADLPGSLRDLFGPELQQASQRPVSEFMKPNEASIDADDSIAKALFLMIKLKVSRLPVLQDNKLAGMIRLSDLFQEISDIVLGDDPPGSSPLSDNSATI